MTQDAEQAIAELRDVVRCRCAPAYTDRGLRDPGCECDSAPAVDAVAAHIAYLEAKVARYEAAVKEAYFEGYRDANGEWQSAQSWAASKSRAALEGD